jgi:hypothetical protein
MKSLSLRTLHLLKSALAAVAIVSLAGSPAWADRGNHGNPNPSILPPGSNPFGMSYGEWGDAWIRWAYSIPADQNPILDLTGQDAAVGQSGKVWFLAGTAGGAAERTITVPEGKALFFPIGEWVWVNTPEFGDNPWSPAQEAYTRGYIAAQVDDYVNLSCQIDGREVANLGAYRFKTPPGQAFMVAFPDNNVWGIPAGTYGPSVDDGYWLMLAPLSHGQHTIHFTAAQGSYPWSLDVTYHITVAPAPRD